MPLDALHGLVDRLARAPGIRQMRQHRWEAYFRRNPGLNLFQGIYPSYEDARSAIPPSARAGYDTDAAAALYADWFDVFDYDYPAMFWVQRALIDGARHIVDLGGHIGIKYYAFSRHCRFPDDLHWEVVDVPAVIQRGRSIAAERTDAPHLNFSNGLPQSLVYDVLFASGSLQYLPESLSQLLQGRYTPSWIIVNTMPLHPRHSYFTVNSFGPGFAAYRVERRNDFVQAVENLGYRLLAEWRNIGKTLDLPFNRGYGLDHYTGMTFFAERRA